MNNLNCLSERKSIRRFKNDRISEDLLLKIIKASQQAPTASEFYSVIWVKEKKIIDQLPYKRENAEILIICVDFNRLNKLLQSNNQTLINLYSWVGLWGMIDASLFMQNIITACEIHKLGTVIFGGVIRKLEEYCKLLSIPKKVLPIAGLAIGYPAETPNCRPRINLETILHINKYGNSKNSLIDDTIIKNKKRQTENYYEKYGKLSESEDSYSYLKHLIYKFSDTKISETELLDFQFKIKKQLDLK